MSAFADGVAQRARDAASGFLCAAGAAQGLYNDVISKVNPLFEGSPGGRYGRGLERALRGFCPVPSPGGNDGSGGAGDFWPGPSWGGGQCDGILYRVQGTYRLSRNNGAEITNGTFDRTTRGRITFIGEDPNASGAGLLVGKDISGNPENLFLGGIGGPDNTWTLTSVNITRLDGLPDDCGDPPPGPDNPPSFPDPAPPPTPFPPPSPGPSIDWPGIGPIIPVLAPIVGIVYLDADATFKVPVTVNVDLPDVSLNFDMDFTVDLSRDEVDIDIYPPPRRPDGRPERRDCPQIDECEPPKEPGSPTPTGTDPEEKDPEIRGVVVLASIDPTAYKNLVIFADEAPPVLAPRCGSIHFEYETEEGFIYYSKDFDVRNGAQYIEAPPAPHAVGAIRANPNIGVEFELVVVYR